MKKVIEEPAEILTVADLAALLKCKPSSVYNLTRRRGRARYEHRVPVLRLPCGLRFRPQWSPQSRPMVVRAKPANGRGRGLSCFTPRLAAEASRFSYANSEDRI